MSAFTENQFGLDRFVADETGLADVEPAMPASKAGVDRPSERRRHTRYTVDGDAEVLVADGSQIFRGRILDISLSGCFIETKARLRMAIGTQVEMVFRANSVMLRTAATVRAVRIGIGAGFLFEGLSERMKTELEELISMLCGEPLA